MSVRYTSLFLNACQDIFMEVAGVVLKHESTIIKISPVTAKNVVVLIGITGDLKGSVILSLNEEFAIKVASNMMGGVEIHEFDEISKSAISELGNMILGRVCTELAEKKMKVDITPPSLMTGNDISLTVVNKAISSIHFLYGDYDLELDLSIID